MTGWLSTCSVALPPLRVNRTTWYLPSLTITALSSMIMSSVPTLKITPIFPLSYGQRRAENIVRRRYQHREKKKKRIHKHISEKVHTDICYPLNSETIFLEKKYFLELGVNKKSYQVIARFSSLSILSDQPAFLSITNSALGYT